MVYLDNNASTPVDPEVREAVLHGLKEGFGNPSSSHAFGLRAREMVESARASVAGLLGCRPENIYFTSGGTESNNIAIIGTAKRRGKGHVITSLIEHPSVLNPVRYLESIGFEATYVGVEADCRVSAAEVEKAIRKNTILITIMHSNNETGVLQPVDEIYEAARSRGIVFHTDTAQSIGKMPVSVCADMMTIVSHKFYGPKGIGALYVSDAASPAPILFGAGHERGLRPGTENVPGILGLGKACEIADREMPERVAHSSRLSQALLDGLDRAVKDLRLNGHDTLRLPNTINVRIAGIDASEVASGLGDSIALSTGSACHAGVKKPSPVLKAMGLSDEDALSSLRLSVGKHNTEADIREAVKILSEALLRPGRARSRLSDCPL